MGEAKRRGTFEQRKALAIKRNAKIAKEQKLTERQIVSPKIPKHLPIFYGVSILDAMKGRYFK